MIRYCKACRKPRDHRKLAGLNLPQKAIGALVLLGVGLPPIFDGETFECNHCGNEVEDE